jgi:flagellar biosynthesis GTPase FlhF
MGNPFRISGSIAEMNNQAIEEAIAELTESVKYVRTNKLAWIEQAKNKIEEEAREEQQKNKSAKKSSKEDNKKDSSQKSMLDKKPDSDEPTQKKEPIKEQKKEEDLPTIPKPPEEKPVGKSKSSIPIIGVSSQKTKPQETIPDDDDDDTENDSPFVGGDDDDAPVIPEDNTEDVNPFSVSSWV